MVQYGDPCFSFAGCKTVKYKDNQQRNKLFVMFKKFNIQDKTENNQKLEDLYLNVGLAAYSLFFFFFNSVLKKKKTPIFM